MEKLKALELLEKAYESNYSCYPHPLLATCQIKNEEIDVPKFFDDHLLCWDVTKK